MFGIGANSDDCFDDEDEFVPATLPDPGPFLAGHSVLEGDEHVVMHDHARDAFEEYGVYDATFGYNLTRLNLDRRHPDAGLRYAWDADDPGVLRVEFTPTTPFCPQSESLTRGTFRALTATREREKYERVSVRVHPMHNAAEGINETLERGEARFAETGSLDAVTRSGSASRTERPF